MPLILMHAEQHTTFQEIVAGAGSLFTGGLGFRYARIAAQTMPPPEPDSRWYAWAFRFLQQVFDNGHMLDEPGAGVEKGGDPKR